MTRLRKKNSKERTDVPSHADEEIDHYGQHRDRFTAKSQLRHDGRSTFPELRAEKCGDVGRSFGEHRSGGGLLAATLQATGRTFLQMIDLRHRQYGNDRAGETECAWNETPTSSADV